MAACAQSAAGGSVDKKTINGPWTYKTTASQAQPDGLPTLTAELPQTSETRSLALLANGSWRTTTTDTSDNADGQVDQVDAKGDGTSSDPEICTTTAYASSSANPMMETYPSQVLAAAYIGRFGARALADPVVTFDNDAAHAALAKLDCGGKSNRTGTDNHDIRFRIDQCAHMPA